MPNQCTKFEVSSISHFRDILEGIKIKNDSCNMTMQAGGWAG